MHILQSIDIQILKFINQHRTAFFDHSFIAITDTAGIVAYSIPVILLILSLLKKCNLQFSKIVSIPLTMAMSGILSQLIKHFVQRQRPYHVYDFIQKLSVAGSSSFPSGHTADAFALATALSLVFPKRQVIVTVYIWAFTVAYSRMYLGVHYPSDVVGGVVVGASSAIVCYMLVYWRLIKH